MNQSPVLRPYQEECLSALSGYARSGKKRALVAMATGSGKTIIFSQLPEMSSKKVLVLAHREELLDQAAEKMQQANSDLDISVEQAERHFSPMSNVVIASVQTWAVNSKRLAQVNPAEFSVVVVDEAHHSIASSYLRILSHFGLAPRVDEFNPVDLTRREVTGGIRKLFEDFRPDPTAPFLAGFTATPNRTDGRGLECVFDDIVYSKSIRELMEEGWLCPIQGMRITTMTDISAVKVQAGDFQERALAVAVNTPERNSLAVHAYMEHAMGRKALVFCVDVEHTEEMYKTFLAAGIKAEMVVGTTPKEIRHDVISRYRNGDVDVLVNCMVLVEGFDAPETSCLVMARPTKSSLLYTQILGRGTRTFPGKDHLLVLDMVDIAKAGVASLNTLFGLPPKLSLKGKDLLSVRKAMDQYEGKLSQGMMDGLTTLEEVSSLAAQFDPLRQATPERDLTIALAWVRTSFGYALSLPGGEQLGAIQDLLGHTELRVKGHGAPSRLIGHYSNVQEALTAAEVWVGGEQPEAVSMLRRDAKWRDGPPTLKQIALAARLRIHIPPRATKGDVSTLLSRRLSG